MYSSRQKINLIRLLVLTWGLFFHSQNLLANHPSLKFKNLYYSEKLIELSGLHFENGHFYSVADKSENHFIYELKFSEPNILTIKPFINIKNLRGYNSYYLETLLFPQFGNWFQATFDFEGITSCNDNFYVVNEQVRHVLKITENKIQKLKIDFLSYFENFIMDPKLIDLNAGFEGIAIDCKNEKIYIAQERSPRRILVVDLLDLNNIDQFDLTDDDGQKFKDIAGLHFEYPYLYVLERSHHVISKYDVRDKKLISKISFENLNGFNLHDLYDTGEPYGIAEGLTMDENHIYIALDNNRMPLSKKGKDHFHIKGSGATVLVFLRSNF